MRFRSDLLAIPKVMNTEELKRKVLSLTWDAVILLIVEEQKESNWTTSPEQMATKIMASWGVNEVDLGGPSNVERLTMYLRLLMRECNKRRDKLVK